MADAQSSLFGRGDPRSASDKAQARSEGPERKLLTILFVDIVSSSAMVVGRDPEEADTALLSILSVLVEAVTRYDGTVSQLLGDGFMAVFGAPDAKEDHTLRACLAAQDIVRATAEFDIPGFRIRVGLDSGDAVAQVVRSGQWSDYRTVGECVHVAAKLQQRADPNTVQLSRNVLDLVPVGVAAAPAGRMVLAPGAAPVLAYTLEGARAVRRTAADLLSSTTAPLVGRETERALLFETAAIAERGASRTLVLRGEAGIGKSRLVGELLHDRLTRDWGQLHWAQMPVRRLGDPDDLEAVAQSLAVLLTGTVTGDGPLRVAEAAGRRAGSLAGDAVRSLLGLPAHDPLWSGLDPPQRLALAIEGLVGAVLDRAACAQPGECPMLILVEDAHWARPVMARFLDALTTALAAPMAEGERRHAFLLATMRPPSLGPSGVPEGWTPPRTTRHVDLEALNPEQARRFLDHWLGDDPSLADLKSKVSARSQGVPLYLEEILRSLEAAGDISGQPGAFRLVNPEITLRLPRTVHALLAARIDRLQTDPRRVLMRAAVVGNTFDFKLLRSLQPVNDSALPDELAFLEQAGFVTRARLLPNLEFVFRHALIREVAYSTLTIGDRKALHGKLVGALRGRRDSDLPNRVDLLAHHAFKAESWPVAYAYGRRAGERAEYRSKLEDASTHYGNALTSIEHLPKTRRNLLRQVDLRIALPRSLLPRGVAAVGDHFQVADHLARELGDPVRMARTASMMASFRWAHADLDGAIALCNQGLGFLSVRDDRNTRIQLLLRLSGILADKGLFVTALDRIREGNDLIGTTDLNSRFGMAVVGAVLPPGQASRSYAEIGNSREAESHGMHAIAIAEESGHAFSKVIAYTHLAWARLILGNYSGSRQLLQEALELCELIRAPLWRPLLIGGLGLVNVMEGRRDHGLALFDECLRVLQYRNRDFKSAHPRVSLPQVLIWKAQALAHAGMAEQAYQAAAEARAAAVAAAQLVYEARASWLMAVLSVPGPTIPSPAMPIWDERLSRGRLLDRCLQLATELSMRPLADAAAQAATGRRSVVGSALGAA